VRHVGDQFVEHAALPEQRMRPRLLVFDFNRRSMPRLSPTAPLRNPLIFDSDRRHVHFEAVNVGSYVVATRSKQRFSVQPTDRA